MKTTHSHSFRLAVRRLAAVLLLAGAALFPIPAPAFVGPAVKVASKQIDEALEAAAKLSGRRVLSEAGEKALAAELRKAATRYGNDALLAARRGGLELIEAAGKHGDEVWTLANRFPGATRQLAVRADDLMPLIRNYGDDVLRLESKTPGVSGAAIQSFGREGLEILARREIPAKDLHRLLAYGGKADSPETARRLLQGYLEKGEAFLGRLSHGRILAYGLSAAAVAAAWNISDGAGDAMRESPEILPATVGEAVRHLSPLLIPLGIGLGLAVLYLAVSRSRRLARRAANRTVRLRGSSLPSP